MELYTNQTEVKVKKAETGNTCCETSNEIKSEKVDSCCEQPENDSSCCDKNVSKEVNSKKTSCC